MPKINILENSLINKIAAGEVVERPASVVKELAENAVDAGASRITIEIADGGISLIKITDDGCGIEREFARAAFLRHATSKIASQDDLENIVTLGFRGEALSSVAAVAQVEMTTRTADSETGLTVAIEGGVVTSEAETACLPGTSVSVRNLFYNTPARRKFLKKPSAESAQVSETVSKMALARPDISFKYINNGSEMFFTNGNGDGRAVLAALYGRDAAARMIEVSARGEGCELSGLIGAPDFSRANRAYGHFFLNGRWIRSEIVSSAVEDAYKTRLMSGRFPVFALYLKTEPSAVDVNVHPAKLEVRFEDENFIYDFVKKAVENALSAENLIPLASLDNPRKTFAEETGLAPIETEDEPKLVFEAGDAAVSLNEEAPGYKPEPDDTPDLIYISYQTDDIAPEPEQKAAEPARPPVFTDYRIIGQAFGTYWIIESGESLYIIDQHAAHERVMYEELCEQLGREKIASQRLTMPLAVNLSEAEAGVVRENRALLEDFGFELEEFGGQSFAIRAVPYIFGGVIASDASFFNEIIDRLNTVSSIKTAYDAKAADIAEIACKAAVKARDMLGHSEARGLIERLARLANPFSCPHGRPTMIELTKYEFEKKFKRVV